MIGYCSPGCGPAAPTHYYLPSLPVMLMGVLLGRVLDHGLHQRRIYQYIYLGLIGIGGLLLTQAITGRG